MHEEPDVDAKSAKAFASFAFPPLRPLRWNSSLRSPPTARRGSPAPPRHVASECGPVREGRYFDLWAFPLFFICIFDYVKMPDADFTSERSEVKSSTSRGGFPHSATRRGCAGTSRSCATCLPSAGRPRRLGTWRPNAASLERVGTLIYGIPFVLHLYFRLCQNA